MNLRPDLQEFRVQERRKIERERESEFNFMGLHYRKHFYDLKTTTWISNLIVRINRSYAFEWK